MRLILTAHGSVDPRSVATSHAVADRIRDLRPRLDVRVAFCEKSTPNLREVLAELDKNATVIVAGPADRLEHRNGEPLPEWDRIIKVM